MRQGQVAAPEWRREAAVMMWHLMIGCSDVAGKMDASASERTCPAAHRELELGFVLREISGGGTYI